MIVPESQIGKEPAPFWWSNERFLALVESGVIEEGRGVELIDGQVMETVPQGRLHFLVFMALQQAFAALGLFAQRLVVQPTIVLSPGNTFDPEFAVLRPGYSGQALPKGGEIDWVIEVSVTSRHIDLGHKRRVYAESGVPVYWVVDPEQREIHVFTEPGPDGYRGERIIRSGEAIEIPTTNQRLDTARIFPPVVAVEGE